MRLSVLAVTLVRDGVGVACIYLSFTLTGFYSNGSKDRVASIVFWVQRGRYTVISSSLLLLGFPVLKDATTAGGTIHTFDLLMSILQASFRVTSWVDSCEDSSHPTSIKSSAEFCGKNM